MNACHHTLAYIGPGPGWLLDPKAPWLYVLIVGALVVAWFVAGLLRGRRNEP